MAERTKLPRYARVKNPPSMRLTNRDKQIMEAIYAYDGMLGFSQLKRLFFTGETQAKQRLKVLYQNGYLNRPTLEQRRKMPEMVYWLDKRGAQIVASLNGLSIREFSWRKQPRWFQVEHDLAVNDFRLDFEQACSNDPDFELIEYRPEGDFTRDYDLIKYDQQGKRKDRRMRPDGYMYISTPNHYFRYLLEIDRGTEPNCRIYRDKLIPGLAYLETEKYERRFGHKGGRWLVVTTSEKRMMNMLLQAKRAEAYGLFYFTTYDQVTSETMLRSAIWYRHDRNEPVPLVFLK